MLCVFLNHAKKIGKCYLCVIRHYIHKLPAVPIVLFIYKLHLTLHFVYTKKEQINTFGKRKESSLMLIHAGVVVFVVIFRKCE